MQLEEKLKRLRRLDDLIRRKATGSPDQLAYKLDVSRRTVFRLIDFLRNFGAPIAYCGVKQRYYYREEGWRLQL